MPRHNNVRPGGIQRKDYQRWIKCHFNQPIKKRRRATKRRMKAARMAPRPINSLRPIVQCNTIKYNLRSRMGRGFTPKEIKRAGISSTRYARTIGIAMDRRRKNKSWTLLHRNVNRLKEYLGNLVLFPLSPEGEDRQDKEKMIAHLMAVRKAKLKMAGHQNVLTTPMKYEHKRKIANWVKLEDVPDYDAYGTMKLEWVWKKKHFRFRRKDLRAAYKKKKEAEKAAKKKAKGK